MWSKPTNSQRCSVVWKNATINAITLIRSGVYYMVDESLVQWPNFINTYTLLQDDITPYDRESHSYPVMTLNPETTTHRWLSITPKSIATSIMSGTFVFFSFTMQMDLIRNFKVAPVEKGDFFRDPIPVNDRTIIK